MKSPVQRLIWERKVGMLKRRPVAPEPLELRPLRRFAFLLIRSEPVRRKPRMISSGVYIA